jgi:hypothetical protein
MEHITSATVVIRNKALGFNQGCDQFLIKQDLVAACLLCNPVGITAL